jgi:hypothetical protein
VMHRHCRRSGGHIRGAERDRAPSARPECVD